MKAHRIISLILFLFFSISLSAQHISIQVSADRVSVGESFLVAYTLEGSVDEFNLPDFKGFQVYQTGQSTNVSIINGKISKSISQNITLVPLSVGTFEIAPARAVINGKKVTSPSFTIEVVNNNQAPRSQNQKIDAPSDNWRDNIFLLAEVDKKQIYVGEQVTITYKLLRRLDYQSMEVEKLPVFKGFLSEEMEIPNHQAEGVVEYRGQRFYYQAFRKVALFAAQAGKQTIDPLVARGVILIPDRDPFYGTTMFSSASPKVVSISSNSLQIEVLPLPTENQPENFSGAVGQFQANRSLSTTQIKQGQSATMQIEISGWGNLKAISPLSVEMGNTFEVFDPEILDRPKKNGESYGGIRTFNYAVVPQKTGNIIIPSYEFVYFDPQQKSYIIKELPEVALNVLENDGTVQDEVSKGNHFQEALKSTLAESSTNSMIPIALALASGLPFMAFIGLLAWRRKKAEQITKSSPDFKWPDLDKYPEQKKYSVLAQTFRDHLKTSLNVTGNIDSAILLKIEDQNLQQKVAFILVSCDRAAYSPMVSTSVKELQALADDVISKISQSAQP